jgi:hypothetical protein
MILTMAGCQGEEFDGEMRGSLAGKNSHAFEK